MRQVNKLLVSCWHKITTDNTELKVSKYRNKTIASQEFFIHCGMTNSWDKKFVIKQFTREWREAFQRVLKEIHNIIVKAARKPPNGAACLYDRGIKNLVNIILSSVNFLIYQKLGDCLNSFFFIIWTDLLNKQNCY